jgi:transposase
VNESILLLSSPQEATEKSKDEIIEEYFRLRDEYLKLRQENEELKKQIKPAFIKIPVYKRKKRWKKLGRPVGHPGSTRPKPEVIDHIVEQKLERCPDCGRESLSELVTEAQEHIQEDIVPARVEATKFIRHSYWCSECKQEKTAPYAAEEVPYGYLGPNVLVQTILMKYHHGLPYSKIQMMFKELCGLTVTDSALAQALQRLARWLEVEKQVIRDAVRASPWIHGDETGWKIAGGNHWLWDFVNQKLAL